MRRICCSLLLVAWFALTVRPALGGQSLQTNEPRLLSVSQEGIPGQSWSAWPSISYDGQYVAFASAAPDLVPGDTNQAVDIFLYSRKTDALSRVSIHTRGTEANAGSLEPVLASGGQVVVFTSLATNLAGPFQQPDTNAAADVFAYDRSTLTTQRISVATGGSQAEGWSHQASVSADGRFIAFTSTAANLDPSDKDESADIFLFDRSKEVTQLVSQLPPVEPDRGEATHPFISADGRFIAFRYRSSSQENIYLYDRIEKQVRQIAAGSHAQPLAITAGPVLSPMGESVAWLMGNGASRQLIGYNRTSGALSPQSATLFALQTYPATLEGYFPDKALQAAAAYNGNAIAYTLATTGIAQVYLQEIPGAETKPSTVAGWVSDSTGYPLGGVHIRLGSNRNLTTGLDGTFRFDEVPAGKYTLEVEKEGYEFTPPKRQIQAAPGLLTGLGIDFAGLPGAVVAEATLDIGMPYSLERGCPSPFEPCGGPYHGFYRGDCTDLVIDAYLSGVNWDIQIALEMDALNHPRHYYRWHNARNAHDMWRFFTYSDQIFAPDQPYQIGDIVFFDWEMDGRVDHVAVISEISPRGRPKKMIDATGIIDENPSGLAIELDWKSYHSAQTPGHARWRGTSNLIADAVPADQAVVIFALDSTAAHARVHDAQGRLAGAAEEIDGIPGSQALQTPLGQVISILQPAGQAGVYLVEITSDKTIEYQLGLQILLGGTVQSSESFLRPITAGETQWIPVQMLVENGKLHLSLPGLR